MPEVALVAHQHDHNVGVRVVPQLLQPPLHILIRDMLGDVVHEQCAHSSPVVRARDRAIPLLPRSVPDLRLDSLPVDLNAPGGELHADGGLGLEAELVAREPREEVRFPDPRVSNQHDLEEVVVIVIGLVCHGCGPFKLSCKMSERMSEVRELVSLWEVSLAAEIGAAGDVTTTSSRVRGATKSRWSGAVREFFHPVAEGTEPVLPHLHSSRV
mmetsp:Transcript_40997/g.131083  ORF Transcript_40997/g.131083 Transcript_40997/m.131083 type:complete len:213 (+) Transcript_40997:451-1089(+)